MNRYLQLPTWVPKAEADFFETSTGSSQNFILPGLKCVLEQELLLIMHVWNPEQDLRALLQNWVGLFVLHSSNHSTCAIRMHLFHYTWCPSCNSCNSLIWNFSPVWPLLFWGLKFTSEARAWGWTVPARVSPLLWGWLWDCSISDSSTGQLGKCQGMSGIFLMSLVNSDYCVVRELKWRGQRKIIFFEVEKKLHKLRT